MDRANLIFEIHKSSPMYSTKKLQEMSDETLNSIYTWVIKPQAVKMLKDETVYDQQGNRVVFETTDSAEDILEPYDPSYLQGKTDSKDDNPYEVSNWEKRFFHKVSILQNKMRKAGIPYEWDERRECFRIWKYVNGSEYPTYRYMRVNVDENEYAFGDEKYDLEYDGRVSVVINAALGWLQAKYIKK